VRDGDLRKPRQGGRIRRTSPRVRVKAHDGRGG